MYRPQNGEISTGSLWKRFLFEGNALWCGVWMHESIMCMLLFRSSMIGGLNLLSVTELFSHMNIVVISHALLQHVMPTIQHGIPTLPYTSSFKTVARNRHTNDNIMTYNATRECHAHYATLKKYMMGIMVRRIQPSAFVITQNSPCYHNPLQQESNPYRILSYRKSCSI